MQAQYKSTLCCPTCKNISVTYDPYMMLSLPIPQNEVYTNLVYYMPYDSSYCPVKSKFFLKKSETMMDLRRQIAEQMRWKLILGLSSFAQLNQKALSGCSAGIGLFQTYLKKMDDSLLLKLILMYSRMKEIHIKNSLKS